MSTQEGSGLNSDDFPVVDHIRSTTPVVRSFTPDHTVECCVIDKEHDVEDGVVREMFAIPVPYLVVPISAEGICGCRDLYPHFGSPDNHDQCEVSAVCVRTGPTTSEQISESVEFA